MRRLILLVVVLVGLLALADRIAVLVAERNVAEAAENEPGVPERPQVTIGGFPFLTQLVRGRYDDVTVTLHDLNAGPVPVSRLTAHLTGVRVPFGDVVRQHVRSVPTDHARAELLVLFADVNRYLADAHIRLSAGEDGRLHVTATGSVGGATVSGGADVPITVQHSTLVGAGAGGVEVRIPLPGLPFGVRLNAAKATSSGIVVTASADDLVLRR